MILLFGCFSQSQARVYKCKAPDGKIAYQQVPCQADAVETRPIILKAPTLTEEEQFNAAAYAEGMTPKEARRLLDNLGSGEDRAKPIQPLITSENTPTSLAEPIETAYRCTKLDGRSYVTSVPCPARSFVVTDFRSGAGFRGPVTEEVVDRGQACQEAKARRDRSDKGYRARRERMPAEERRGLDRSVDNLCR